MKTSQPAAGAGAAGVDGARPRTARRTRRRSRRSAPGAATAAVLTLTLSAPARSSRRASSTVRMPPPTVNGMNTSSAVRPTTSTIVSRPSRRRGDVEEDQLVGALGVVAGGQLDRVAGVAQVDEVHALDDAAGVDVEAGDDPGDPHDRHPGQRGERLGRRRSGPRRAPCPTIDPGQPPARARPGPRRSSSVPTPPDAITGTRSVARQPRRRPVEVGAGQHAVAADLGDDERVAPASAKRPSASSSRTPAALGPAVDGDLAAAVRRARRRPATTAATVATSVGSLDARRCRSRPGRRRRRRAPSAVGRRRARRRRSAPGTPAPPRRWPRRPARLTGLAGAGGVEVDDVDPRRAGGGEGLGDGHRVVAVDGLAGRSRPGAAARPARRAGRWPGRGPSAWPATPAATRDEVGQQLQARRARTSPGGTAWRTRCRARPRRRPGRRSRTWRRRRAGSSGTPWSECTKYTHGPVAEAGEQRRRRRRSVEQVPLHLRALHAGGQPARPCPGSTPRPGDAGRLLGPARRASACRRRCRGTAGRRSTASSGDVVEARRRAAPPCTRPNAPTPGSTTRGRVARSRPWSAVRRASAPTCSSAFWAERRLPMP